MTYIVPIEVMMNPSMINDGLIMLC